jgi:hypothetical protein
MGEDNTTPTFAPEARAELLAMYTGLALQGLLSDGGSKRNFENVAADAVEIADATVTALEKYHANRAKLEQANAASPQ